MREASKDLLRALTLVLAFSALTAASASATPNYPEFMVHEPGHIIGSFPASFTGTGVAADFYEQNGGVIECRTNSITGEIINSKEVANVKLTFGGGGYCASTDYFCAGYESKWETSTLKGRIAYLSKTSKIVGLLLEPVKQPFAPCREYNEITGSIIGQISPVNRSVTEATLKYEGSPYGQQTWRHFEGEELLHNLALHISQPPYTLGLSDTITLKTSKTVEILA
jgi:hypothetical protein